MPHAGELRERVTFAKRTIQDDSYGNEVEAFADQFTVAARIVPRLGGEGVMAARLEGTQPYIISVRYSSQTKQIDSSWRCTNARTGEAYNVRSIANVDEVRRFLDILVTSGTPS